MLRNTEELTAVRMAEIERLVNEFREILEKEFADIHSTMRINEIEELWTKLRTGTDEVYSDMLSDYLASVDESEVIRQKKRISGKGNKTPDGQESAQADNDHKRQAEPTQVFAEAGRPRKRGETEGDGGPEARRAA